MVELYQEYIMRMDAEEFTHIMAVIECPDAFKSCPLLGPDQIYRGTWHIFPADDQI